MHSNLLCQSMTALQSWLLQPWGECWSPNYWVQKHNMLWQWYKKYIFRSCDNAYNMYNSYIYISAMPHTHCKTTHRFIHTYTYLSKAQAIATPAEGPSLLTAPSGTWICTLCVLKKAWCCCWSERLCRNVVMYVYAIDTLSFITSPSCPVTMRIPPPTPLPDPWLLPSTSPLIVRGRATVSMKIGEPPKVCVWWKINN